MSNIDKIREWVDKLKPRFTSSNSHHVDRAHVTKAEFDSLLALLDGLGDGWIMPTVAEIETEYVVDFIIGLTHSAMDYQKEGHDKEMATMLGFSDAWTALREKLQPTNK